ncbi:class I adenylate-forming enzyme family protein [Microbacterium sp.]|uniref:class I adenylate-forming enzyme family protein n=1 Tax=Microbacterium sp. TaxID=51671 RepID=UPI0037C5DCF3
MDATPSSIGPLSIYPARGHEHLIDESIPAVLERRLPQIADRPVVTWWEDGTWDHLTYGALAEQATLVARALAAAAEPGDRVLVWGRNSLPYVVMHYAAAMANVVLTPLNTLWSDDEVRHAVQLVRPALFFAGDDIRGAALLPRAVELAGTVPVTPLGDLLQWAQEQPAADLPEVRPDDAFLIQFTSGTTGKAKGAVVTHRAALNGASERNRPDSIIDGDVWLNPVPYHHIGGSCFVMFGALLSGNAFVLVDRWDPDKAVEMLLSGQITRVGGVPTMLVDLLARIGDAGKGVRLQSVPLGGATVSAALVRRIRAELGAQTLIGYGQSECSLITSTDVSDDPETVARTVGRPIAGTAVRIADPATSEPVPLGEPGEIQVIAPNVMRGYWEDPQKTAEVFTEDGYLRTGDLGVMDENGYIEFRGRVRDVIIRGGENVYPAEVEELLTERPDIAAAVLVGVEDERLGEKVAGVVVRAPGATVSGDELAEYLTGKVARFKIPVAWRFVDELPMTASAKVRRFIVREETERELAANPDTLRS